MKSVLCRPGKCVYRVMYARRSCLEFALMQFKALLTKFGVRAIENNPNSQIPSLFLCAKKKKKKKEFLLNAIRN